MATFDSQSTSGRPAPYVFPILSFVDVSSRSADDVRLLTATVQSSYVVRVALSAAIEGDAGTINPANWTIVRVAPIIGVVPTILSIAENGTYLDFTLSLQTIGQNYRITALSPSGVIAGQTSDFVGDADSPAISSITLVSYTATTRTGIWRVTFSRAMQDTGLSSPSDFAITARDGGAVAAVVGVTPESSTPTYVDVEVRGMTPGRRYRLRAENA